MWLYAVAALIVTWLVGITVLLFKTRNHYQRLTTRIKKERIDQILDGLLEHDQRLLKETEEIKKHIQRLDTEGRFHFQKIGMVRFNPFGRTGGTDQSFVLALLDSTGSGIVINFIYTHEGVRVYAKKIKDGKGTEYKLTEEEEKAIKASA